MSWEIQPGSGGEKAPTGNHLAVLVGLFDLGEQWQEPFDKTKSPYWQHRAFFVWELVGEKIEGTNKNHLIGIDLTMSIDERSKLHKWVLARTGKPPAVPFNPTSELGQACFLNVVDNKGYPKIEGVAAVPKGVPVPAATYPLTVVALEEFRSGAKTIPDWCPWMYGSPLSDHIRASKEIGEPKPEPRKGGGGNGASQPARQQSAAPAPTQPAPATNPNTAPIGNVAQTAADPAARWDYSDGSIVVQNKTSLELQAEITNLGVTADKIRCKPHGAPPSAAKPAKDYGFIDGNLVPW